MMIVNKAFINTTLSGHRSALRSPLDPLSTDVIDYTNDSLLYMYKRYGDEPKLILDYTFYQNSFDGKTRQSEAIGLTTTDGGVDDIAIQTPFARLVLSVPYFDTVWQCNVVTVITHYPINKTEYLRSIEEQNKSR